MVHLLPLEWTGGCDGTYKGCEADLPSGLHLDEALLQCALRRDLRRIKHLHPLSEQVK